MARGKRGHLPYGPHFTGRPTENVRSIRLVFPCRSLIDTSIFPFPSRVIGRANLSSHTPCDLGLKRVARFASSQQETAHTPIWSACSIALVALVDNRSGKTSHQNQACVSSTSRLRHLPPRAQEGVST